MNSHPVILVYGFMGFDARSFVRLPYWGGTVVLEQKLRERGHSVYTARIGPVSSNWDRACELYAAIRGGWVDYGAAHAERMGHHRYGTYYEALYPEWGSVDPSSGELRKVHLVGHSMGGQTGRLLISLLEEGDAAERGDGGLPPSDELSPLFEGGRSWVESVSTLSTPHDGTTITSEYRSIGFVRRLFAKWLASSSAWRKEPMIDLQLDHWERRKREDEGFAQFLRRAVDEELWRENEDFSFYELSPKGARQLNNICPASPRSFYLSWSLSCSEPDPETGYHQAVRGTNLPLYSNVRFLGSLEELPEGAEGEAQEWWENDGIVNTRSMNGPKSGSDDTIREYDGELRRGGWNHMGKLHPYDHWQIHVGPPLLSIPPPGYESLVDFFDSLCKILRSL